MPKVYDSPTAIDDGEDHTWSSGIFKHRVDGPIWLDELNLGGDGQADLVHHGGKDRAVLLYSANHYPAWEKVFGHPLESGSFGENFTVTNVDEQTVCLGDRWASDEIEIEISQPRLPCFKLARRLNRPGLNVEVMKNRQGGWYARTIRQGHVEGGHTLTLKERPNPKWTIDRCFLSYMNGSSNRSLNRELMELPQLSTLWKDRLAARLSKLG